MTFEGTAKKAERRRSWLREVAERAEESISQRDADLLGPAARLLAGRTRELGESERLGSEQPSEIERVVTPSFTVVSNPAWTRTAEGTHMPMIGLVRD